MSKKKISQIIEEEVSSFLLENGYELYNVEFVKEGRDWFLRVYIDWIESAEDRYISTDDCERVSRYISQKLDELDPIEQNYYLEVSSPGLDRVLLKESDYVRFAGKPVEIKLYQAIDGRKSITGILGGLSDEKVIITNDNGNKIEIPIEQIAKTKLMILF